MSPAEAVELIRPAVLEPGGTWADFGAGTGTFTRALAGLLGRGGRVLAVDVDPRALAALQRAGAEGAEVEAVRGDFLRLGEIAALEGLRLDGVVFANALHFAADAEAVLREVAARTREGGTLVVVEYEGRPASRWVPHPLSRARLATLAERVGLGPPRLVGERDSAYGGVMYCAAMRR